MIKITPRLWRYIAIFTVAALVAVVVIWLNPVNSTLNRLVFLLGMDVVWFGALLLSWKWKWCRIGLLLLALVSVIPFLLPGRAINQEELRSSYLKHMAEFEGTTYHWGGESSRGIDCSGLPRRALRDALLEYGIKHADGGAFRMLAQQWWFDTSAEALGQGYRGFTENLEKKGKISEMSYKDLQPGDLAVTTSGVHVIVYIGDEQWIQADPGIGNVATLNGRIDKNPWFKVPVTLHRWSVLAR